MQIYNWYSSQLKFSTVKRKLEISKSESIDLLIIYTIPYLQL